MNDLINQFLKGKLDKWQFIDAMYEIHRTLFEYSNVLPDTNISEISITDNQVIMTFRDSGIRFIVHEGDKRLAPIDTLNFGNYESDELKMQLRLMQNGQNIFDIGANYGWYALHVALKYPESHIYSFEPIPFTFKQLNNNIALNEFQNIKTFNLGFSDSPGNFSFFYDPLLSVNASLVPVSSSSTLTEIKCSVNTLDSWVNKNHLKVDFIKCDIEGAELLAFRGAENTIRHQMPVVFTEMLRKWTAKFGYSPNDIIDFFKDLGYSCYTSKDQKLISFGVVDENTKETNYFFLHDEGHRELIQQYVHI